jgi:hypothetical protein
MKQEKEFVEQELEEMRVLRVTAEQNRRERSSMPTSPIPGLVDYAAGGVAADNGWRHLNESIVNGQKLRTEAAAELVVLGLYHQLRWLAAAGYKVPTLLWSWGGVSDMTGNSIPSAKIEPYDPLKDPTSDGYAKVHTHITLDPLEVAYEKVGAVGVKLRYSKYGIEVTSATEPTEQANYEQAKRGVEKVLRMQFPNWVNLTLKNTDTGASLHIPSAEIVKAGMADPADFEEHLVSWPQAKVTRFARLVAELGEQLYRDSPVQNAEARSIVDKLKELSK